MLNTVTWLDSQHYNRKHDDDDDDDAQLCNEGSGTEETLHQRAYYCHMAMVSLRMLTSAAMCKGAIPSLFSMLTSQSPYTNRVKRQSNLFLSRRLMYAWSGASPLILQLWSATSLRYSHTFCSWRVGGKGKRGGRGQYAVSSAPNTHQAELERNS